MTIRMRQVRHTYQHGQNVLDELDLDVEPGEVVIITGVSGAGKTTLLTLCGALRTLQHGALDVLGLDLARSDATQQRTLRASIGFIFQSHNLLDALTAGQNVLMSLLGPVPREDALSRAEAALASLGLADKANVYPEALSGGEKQRVAVARALVREPQLILADEPTASLDDASATTVKTSLVQTARTSGCAVLVATHDRRLFDVAHRVLRLEHGRIHDVTHSAPVTRLVRTESPLVREA